MKRSIWTLVLLVLAFVGAFSQPYRSNLGSSVTSWSIYSVVPDAEITEQYTTAGDSLIAPYTYKIVNYSGFAVGLYREDTSVGKAWFVEDGDPGGERLIMDLSLQVGDTFWVHEPFAQVPAVVDSVYWESGAKRVRTDYYLHPHNDSEKLTFIEEIGPNGGVFIQAHGNNTSWSFTDSRYLLCAYKDLVQVYQNPLFTSTCFISSVGLSEEVQSTWQAYPNPVGANAVLRMRGLPTGEVDATLLDAWGKQVRRIEGVHEGDALSLAGLSSGVYALSLRQGSRLLGTHRIVVD